MEGCLLRYGRVKRWHETKSELYSDGKFKSVTKKRGWTKTGCADCPGEEVTRTKIYFPDGRLKGKSKIKMSYGYGNYIVYHKKKQWDEHGRKVQVTDSILIKE
jgi:hypothetical protein